MRIHVIICCGKTIGLSVRPNELISAVKDKIEEKTGIPVSKQRLSFEGDPLNGEITLDYYEIDHGSTLDLQLAMTGMISTFTSNDVHSSALIQYLMGRRPDAPLERLRDKARECEADNFLSFSFQENTEILNSTQRQQICEFMDFMWSSTLSDGDGEENRVDLRMAISDEAFLSLLQPLDHGGNSDHGFDSQSTLENLRALYREVPTAYGVAKIALRQTRGPTGACIAFHCDGGYATSTTQIALNEPTEYRGGRLVYFVNDRLHVLERPAGSVVQHPPKVLHGVTALNDGKRQSLFVVDRANGLGENGVVEVTHGHVNQFLGSQRHPRIPDCVLCSARHVTHVVVPCFHLCVCVQCVEEVGDHCPMCGGGVTHKHKIEFCAANANQIKNKRSRTD